MRVLESYNKGTPVVHDVGRKISLSQKLVDRTKIISKQASEHGKLETVQTPWEKGTTM